MRNWIFPEERLLYSQPWTVASPPARSPTCEIEMVSIKAGDLISAVGSQLSAITSTDEDPALEHRASAVLCEDLHLQNVRSFGQLRDTAAESRPRRIRTVRIDVRDSEQLLV